MARPTQQASGPYTDRAPAMSALTALGPATHALLRTGTGLLFIEHGLQKLFGVFGGFGGTPGATAPLMSQMGFSGVLESVGGLLLIIGLFTRPVAFLVAGEMLIALLTVHLPQGGAPIQNGGELALLYLLVFLFLLANGAGPWSVDDQLRGRRTGRA